MTTPETTTRDVHSQLPMSIEDFAALGGPHLVYIRTDTAASALASQPEAIAEAALTPDQIVYTVHRADGECLAVLGDRATAYAAALAHDLAPVSVH